MECQGIKDGMPNKKKNPGESGDQCLERQVGAQIVELYLMCQNFYLILEKKDLSK